MGTFTVGDQSREPNGCGITSKISFLVPFHQHPQVQDQLEAVELLVRDGALSPVTAAKRLLKLQSNQD